MQSPSIFQILSLRGHTFIPSPLNAGSIIVDLGANRGEFAQLILQWTGGRVISVEANPHLIGPLRHLQGIEVVHAAVAEKEGEIELHLSDNIEASTIMDRTPAGRGSPLNGQHVRVPCCTLAGLLDRFGLSRVDLIKMDIEGAEVPVLLTTPGEVLKRVDQITLEFHDFCGLVTAQQVEHVRERMDSLGFDGLKFDLTNMNWLFVRRNALGLGVLRRYYIKHLVSPARRALHWSREVVRPDQPPSPPAA